MGGFCQRAPDPRHQERRSERKTLLLSLSVARSLSGANVPYAWSLNSHNRQLSGKQLDTRNDFVEDVEQIADWRVTQKCIGCDITLHEQTEVEDPYRISSTSAKAFR